MVCEARDFIIITLIIRYILRLHLLLHFVQQEILGEISASIGFRVITITIQQSNWTTSIYFKVSISIMRPSKKKLNLVDSVGNESSRVEYITVQVSIRTQIQF